MSVAGQIEAVLFASGESIPVKKLAEAAGVSGAEVKDAISALKEKYANGGGLTLVEQEGGFRLTTKKEYAEAIDRYFTGGRRKGLSNAALEVLAIIALRQPVTRSEIDEMRGVSSDSIVQQLIRRELIMCSGKLDAIGSPGLYRTTDKFLEVFQLQGLEELPSVDELMLL